MGEMKSKPGKALEPSGKWEGIGTVVGNTSTDRFSFILKSFRGKVGDIVATRMDVPADQTGEKSVVTVWGRVIGIDRFNPFFPAEAAQELADENIRFLDTVLSGSRDHLEAEVLILGTTLDKDHDNPQLSPLTYPVQPSSEVLYPPADYVRLLLTGKEDRKSPKLRIGSLIARRDVEVSLSARQIVSRHLAILAMTGGGKTVAARRIIRELISIGYPLVIFDPHGDYIGFYEKRDLFPGKKIQLLFPMLRVRENNLDTIRDLIDKMGRRLTDAQNQFFGWLINATASKPGETAAAYIQNLIDHANNVLRKKGDDLPSDIQNLRGNTFMAVIRSLQFVQTNLHQMEQNNKRLREQDRFKSYSFTEMPDPSDVPEAIISPNLVSIFYLAGYDHLNQSAIVSIVLESLFAHRATLTNLIPPFQAIIEEAHNFIPSRVEGTDETPSLVTIRKVITEGRKFGTGLVLISQRPSRLDETTLTQCNSFLVLRLVNPKDKTFVRSVMENLTESDANTIQSFGPGQGIVSGQAVRFPLLVRIDFDQDLISQAIQDEDFISEAQAWRPDPKRTKTEMAAAKAIGKLPARSALPAQDAASSTRTKPSRKGRIKPEGY